ncbi:glycosyltransferase family 2 protein [Candidatus Omnitrophota bacterium]
MFKRIKISVIVPCRNEGEFIKSCLDSIVAQDYAKEDLEVLIVDGMSEDGTRDTVKAYELNNPFIKLLDNVHKTTPYALNLGIKKAVGDFVLWMSAHNEYDKEYITKCLKYIKEFGADAVGGSIRIMPRNKGFAGKLICMVQSHPFGAGKAYFKTRLDNCGPMWVDTAFGICYKKELFNRIGFFNEKLSRGQDMEFNIRLKKAGIKILLAPEMSSSYYARSDYSNFIKHNFLNGYWVIEPFKYSDIIPISVRHLVPLISVLSFIILCVLSIFFKTALLSLLALAVVYLSCSLFFSIKTGIKEKDPRIFFMMPVMFASFHVSYGLGSLWGLIKNLTCGVFWKNMFKILTNINVLQVVSRTTGINKE